MKQSFLPEMHNGHLTRLHNRQSSVLSKVLDDVRALALWMVGQLNYVERL